jgi:hypothetical protein
MRAKCGLSSCYLLDDFACRIWQLRFAGIIVRSLSASSSQLSAAGRSSRDLRQVVAWDRWIKMRRFPEPAFAPDLQRMTANLSRAIACGRD